MKNPPQPVDDGKFAALLREARPAPDLPPGFQRAVWRRIEQSEAAAVSAMPGAWWETVTAWVLRPRLALAGLAVLVVIGTSLGVRDGMSLSRQAAQARYLAAVDPMGTHP